MSIIHYLTKLKKTLHAAAHLQLALLISPHVILAAPGCMDNTRHLTEINDNKEYHFVRCSCPCNKRIAHQDRCIDCRHAHSPEPIEILDSTPVAITPEQTKRYKQFLQNPHDTLQAMIHRYARTRQ